MSNIIDTLKSADGRWLSSYFAAFLATLAPGVLIIYLYKPALFIQLDSLKLILFSLSLSLPLWTVNILLLGPPGVRKGITDFVGIVFFASLAASFAHYASLLICYIFSLRFLIFIAISAVADTIPLYFIFRVFPALSKSDDSVSTDSESSN